MKIKFVDGLLPSFNLIAPNKGRQSTVPFITINKNETSRINACFCNDSEAKKAIHFHKPAEMGPGVSIE